MTILTLKGSHPQFWMRPLQGRDALLAMCVGRVPDAIELVAFSDRYDCFKQLLITSIQASLTPVQVSLALISVWLALIQASLTSIQTSIALIEASFNSSEAWIAVSQA